MITLTATIPAGLDDYGRTLIATELSGLPDFEVTETTVIVRQLRNSTAEAAYKMLIAMGLDDIEEEKDPETPLTKTWDTDGMEDG